MKKSTILILVLTSLPVSLSAEAPLCDATGIAVHADTPTYVELTCEAVQRAKVLFEHCNMPPLTMSLKVEIVSDLIPGCLGLYHCGEGLIEVLEPPLMELRRGPESALAFLTIEDYFQSVIVHELAHAALDGVPCPFETCVVADEYVAHAMQVMSLPPDLRAEYSAISGSARRVSRDDLSAVMLFMAPQVFFQKAWAHLSQRDDPCVFVGQIVDRTVLLDRERFDSSYRGTD